MMPKTVKMSAWEEGKLIREPASLTAVGLRETLLAVLDYDEEKVDYVCQQVEENGAYELAGDTDEPTIRLRKILHS